ncbi:MAG: ribosome hibernation-promoting factor, HPF/YfiA family [Bdellovibrionia bacterium]
MNLTIAFKHMNSSDSLKSFVEEKSETLKRYFHGNISVKWTLSIEKKDHIAHCHVMGNHMDYFGEAVSEEIKASIDLAIDKIEKQIRKHKEIVKDHLHHKARVTTE